MIKGLLNFESFDLEFILEHGPRLLSSQGLEYIEDDELQHLTPRERMKLRKLRASEQRAAQLKQVQCTGVEKGLCVRGWGPL